MFASKDIFLAAPAGYQISRSVRLRSSASGYFSRTFSGAPTNNKISTFSAWVKRGYLGSNVNHIFAGYDGSSALAAGVWFQNDVLYCDFGGVSGSGRLITTQVFRDPSAWYHIVVQIDTTQATASNRARIYVNGVQVTAFSTATYPALNAATLFAYQNANNRIGANWDNTTPLDGYLTEINFIDGQALTPSSFGQTNSYTGVWSPLKYTGTYGTNGFYLNFSDNSNNTATTIGKDYSGNGNNWTPNNISVTAGATYDSMVDVPTQFADGSTGRGNYATLNPLAYSFYTTRTATSGGNLNFSDSTSTNTGVLGTIAVSSGKWYFEMLCTGTGVFSVGLKNPASSTEYSFYRNNGAYSSSFGGSGTTGYSSWTNGDIIGVAWDEDSGKIWYAKNNVWQSGSPSAGTSPTNTFTSGIQLTSDINTDNSAGTKSGSFNFGQRPFSYTPPTGFKALNTLNLSTPTIVQGNQWMDATLYTGNAGSITVTNGGFQPDLVWIKARSQAYDHKWVDSVRGASGGIYYDLSSNNTNAESLPGAGVNGLTSTGFTIGGGTNNGYNGNGTTFVAWQWKANGTPAVTNTSGSITSTVSASTTSGFSVLTYTGNNTNGATVGHGLGVAPKMIITAGRNPGNNWRVFHTSLSASNNLYLNATNAQDNITATAGGGIGTSPTSTTFTLVTGAGGNANNVNGNGYTFVAYCFAEVAGFSKFGSYTGNGSADGPFVFCGFRPRWIMVKRTDVADSWLVFDTARLGYNGGNVALVPNSSSAEGSTSYIDILSNGFKARQSNTEINASGGTYIYAAFSENPFKNALAR